MKKIILLGLSALFSLTSYAQLKVQKERLVRRDNVLYLRENGEDYKVDTKVVTVRLKKDQPLDAKGGSLIRQNKLGYADLRVPDGMSVEDYAEKLEESGLFEVVELNTLITCNSVVINDPLRSNQWYLNKIRAYDAWNYETGDSTIKVAVIDNGTDNTHSDIGLGTNGYKNIDETLGWDYVSNVTYSLPTHNHGTLVAGIIGAKTNNNVGIAGLSGGYGQSGVKIIPYRIGEGITVISSVIDDAILDAVSKGAKVINMSFGGPYNSAENDALNYAHAQGVNLVAASGNNNSSTILFPASHADVIAVGSTNQSDSRANFSNYGAGLDLVAPGVSIYSTTLNNGYTSADGTSFSTPQVSGVIALMLAENPGLTPNQIHTRLINSATKLPNYTFDSNGWNNEVGYGLLNAYAALNAVRLSISGESLICDTSYYYVNNLPDGFSVEWEVDNDYYNDSGSLFQTDYPENNECMIVRSSTIQLSGTLTARIYDETNTLIRTLTKGVATRTIARFPLAYEYGGTPVLMSWLVAENDPAKVPVGAVVKMGSNRFQNMNITATGAYSAFHHEGDSVRFTSASGNTYLRCRSENSCDQFLLVFYTNKKPPIIIDPDLPPIIIDPILSIGDGRLSVTLTQLSEGASDNDMAESVPVSSDDSWQVAVYRYRDGKRLYSQTAQGSSHNVDIYGWEQGLYIVTIKVGEQIFTNKIVL